MTDPILAEVTRGAKVESAHRGAVAVCDADGEVVFALGDIERPIFPRSAVKAIQALPLVESGAADALGLTERELAMACASHNGEPAHAEAAVGMLAKAGLDVSALECGAHWPSYQNATVELAASGHKPSALHNNCSGKHSGFICTCVHSAIDPSGYVGVDHWLQETVRGAMEEVTGAPHTANNRGTDGCSIPTYAVPLRNLAHGFARMGTGEGFGSERAKAAKRLVAACMAEPFYVAGTARVDTAIMQAGRGRVFVKTGAEGVYCSALPELGLGIALKCDDGAGRAAEVAVAAVIAKLFAEDQHMADVMSGFTRQTLTNWNGIEVGTVRAGGALAKRS